MITNNIENAEIIIERCYKHIKPCLNFEHIEDSAYIRKQLKKVRDLEKELSQDTVFLIENYIKMYVYPILFDNTYFNFTRQSAFGAVNSNGIFEVNSEASLDKILFLMYNHCFFLQGCLKEYFKSHFCIKI